MKKLFVIFFLLLFVCASTVLADDFMPKYRNNIKNYGIGLFFGEGKETVYEKPDVKSNVIATIQWDTQKVYVNGKTEEPRNVFAVFLPEQQLAGFVAVDEEGAEFTRIIYNNSKQLQGWIKNDESESTFYWRRLLYKYGKTKGLYFFADIPKEKKNLRMAPEELADISYDFVCPKYVRLQLIKGNWALLKVVEYDSEQKIGWFQWRNQDGTLNLFPQFKD